MFYNVIKIIGKRKEEDDTFLRKKTKKTKQNSVTIMISVGEKGTVFPVKLQLEGESCE